MKTLLALMLYFLWIAVFSASSIISDRQGLPCTIENFLCAFLPFANVFYLVFVILKDK